jgi:hypothetical protein
MPNRHDPTLDSTSAARASAPLPDVMRLLRLDASVAPTNVASFGTCIPIDGTGRSRVVYLMLPAESSYVRLTVVARPGGPIEMVDLVRGIPDGRIWSATLDRRRGATARVFASANDKSPIRDEWVLADQRTQRLTEVAMAAIQSPCASR